MESLPNPPDFLPRLTVAQCAAQLRAARVAYGNHEITLEQWAERVHVALYQYNGYLPRETKRRRAAKAKREAES